MRSPAFPLAAFLLFALQGCIGIPQRELEFEGVTVRGCRTYAGEEWEWRYGEFHLDPSKAHGISILLPDNRLLPLDQITPEMAAPARSGEVPPPYTFHFNGTTPDKVDVWLNCHAEAATPVWVPAFARTGTQLVYRLPLERRELKELFGSASKQRDWHDPAP